MLEIMTAADSEAEYKKGFIWWLVINKPQPNLHSGQTPLFRVNVPWTREVPDILGGQAAVTLSFCDSIYY